MAFSADEERLEGIGSVLRPQLERVLSWRKTERGSRLADEDMIMTREWSSEMRY